jgi:hypothetical protein
MTCPLSNPRCPPKPHYTNRNHLRHESHDQSAGATTFASHQTKPTSLTSQSNRNRNRNPTPLTSLAVRLTHVTKVIPRSTRETITTLPLHSFKLRLVPRVSLY